MKTKEERTRDLTTMALGTWKHNVSRRLVDLEERTKTPAPEKIPLPEGIYASEFRSHGIRAISFKDTNGQWCNVRVPEKGKYEVCWPKTSSDPDWVAGSHSIPNSALCTARVHDWILAVWTTMPDAPEEPQSNPPLPPGAEEFMSDNMRALRFYDSDGTQCEARVCEVDRYEVRWDDPMWKRGSGAEKPYSLTHAAYPWLQSVWAEMRKASSPEDAPAPVPQDPSLLEREKLRACVKALEDKVATAIAERDAATLRENRVSNQLRICKGIKESCQSEAAGLRDSLVEAQTDILELEAERDQALDVLDALKQSSAEERELLRSKLADQERNANAWCEALKRATEELDAFKKEQRDSALSVADHKTGPMKPPVRAINININDLVWVRLTDAGAERLSAFPHVATALRENFYRIQLWELMRTFGPSLSMAGPQMFEGNILFLEKPKSFEILGAETGRIDSSKPNLSNAPREHQMTPVPPEGLPPTKRICIHATNTHKWWANLKWASGETYRIVDVRAEKNR